MKRTLGRRKSGGYAMILVICVMALLVALCLSLLLTSSIVLSGAQNANSMEQCRILAVSLSQQLEKQLVSSQYSWDSQADEDASRDSSLWFYIKDGMKSGTWPYFNEDQRGHTASSAGVYRTFSFASNPEGMRENDTAEIKMFWESEDGSDLDSTPLTILVTYTRGKQSCTVTSEYSLSITTSIDGAEVPEGEEMQGYEQWSWSLNWRE